MPATATAGPPAGRDRWYEKDPGTPLDRFPLFGDALAVAAKVWTDSFCALSASPGELHVVGMEALTVAELAARGRDQAPIYASLRVAGWDSPAALVLSRRLVSTVLEALFGGGEDDEGVAVSRPMSPVEMRIVDVIGGQAATALAAGFRDYAPARFEFERVQPKPEPSFLGKGGTALIAAAFEWRALGRTVPFDVVLPARALEGSAEAWGGSPSTPRVADGGLWALQLQAEVARAAMTLRATVTIGAVDLGRIAAWQVGTVLELPPDAGSAVELSCENEALFHCDLGQSEGRYTLRIGERLSGEAPPPRKGA